MTVHGAQGWTILQAAVDLSRAWAAGQALSGLSRTPTLTGLHLVSFDEDKVVVDSFAVSFYESLVPYQTTSCVPSSLSIGLVLLSLFVDLGQIGGRSAGLTRGRDEGCSLFHLNAVGNSCMSITTALSKSMRKSMEIIPAADFGLQSSKKSMVPARKRPLWRQGGCQSRLPQARSPARHPAVSTR